MKRGYLYDADEMAACATARPEPLPPEHTPAAAARADLECLAKVYERRKMPMVARVLREWRDDCHRRAI